jgi:hypothetical protein
MVKRRGQAMVGSDVDNATNTAIIEEATDLYRIGRVALLTWGGLCLAYVIFLAIRFPDKLLTDYKPVILGSKLVTEIAGRYVIFVTLNGLLVFSALFPVFLMLLSLVVFLKPSKIVSPLCTRSIALFWAVQVLVPYYLKNEPGFFSQSMLRLGERDTSREILVGAVCLVIIYRLIRAIVRLHKPLPDWLNDSYDIIWETLKWPLEIIRVSTAVELLVKALRIRRGMEWLSGKVSGLRRSVAEFVEWIDVPTPLRCAIRNARVSFGRVNFPWLFRRCIYFVVILVLSGVIAWLFYQNLVRKDLTLSNGLVFGVLISLLFVPASVLRGIILFWIVPERYRDVLKEWQSQELETVERRRLSGSISLLPISIRGKNRHKEPISGRS